MKHPILVLTLCLCAALVVGCSNTPKRGPSRPPPPSVKPSLLVMSVGYFQDTNSNGYLDTVSGTLYVFANEYPEASLLLPASLTFHLTGREAKTIREWKLDEAQTAELARRGPAGPGYVFRISLLDNGGSDKIEETQGDLSVTYTTREGVSVRAAPNASRIGRIARQ